MRKDGFTLVELMVVISIICVLVALLSPLLRQVRCIAQTALCLANHHAVLTGINSYAADNRTRYPDRCSAFTWTVSIPTRWSAWNTQSNYRTQPGYDPATYYNPNYSRDADPSWRTFSAGTWIMVDAVSPYVQIPDGMFCPLRTWPRRAWPATDQFGGTTYVTDMAVTGGWYPANSSMNLYAGESTAPCRMAMRIGEHANSPLTYDDIGYSNPPYGGGFMTSHTKDTRYYWSGGPTPQNMPLPFGWQDGSAGIIDVSLVSNPSSVNHLRMLYDCQRIWYFYWVRR
jgi:prepilin-type N-terminal cleavage/methylation domain-containing protein